MLFSISIAIACVAQAALLGHVFPYGLLAGAACGLLWHLRRLFNPHLDMILLMTAFGGLGMALVTANEPTCHRTWSGWLLMNTAMVGASLPPSLRFARCLAGPFPWARVGLDMGGMIGGMELAHRLTALSPLPPPAWLHHTAMLLGMAGGMIVVMGAAARLTGPLGLRRSAGAAPPARLSHAE